MCPRSRAKAHLLVRCGNRRTTRCPSCAELYRQDTYRLIAAGLRGGKNIPEQVATHPRVFATLGALRAARAAWHRRHTPPPSPTTLVLAHWAYDGTGLTPDLERLAALIGGGSTHGQVVTARA